MRLDIIIIKNSLENQKSHYESIIRSNPDYEFIGVYSDFGISGFKEKRPGFQEMMRQAREGNIDLIITKSVSRFARNTVTVLKAARELKEMGVGIFFELQNINTLSEAGELMLTVIAAFAQAESESASVTNKMVYQRKYRNGIPVAYLERSFGYQKDAYGDFIPKEPEAGIVKEMFHLASKGATPASIKRYLNEKGIKTVKGAKWCDSAVIRILENVIYKGDFIMQKHYVNAERKLVKNKGELDRWYVEGNHVPIVSDKLWDAVQEVLKEKRAYYAEGSVVGSIDENVYPYMHMIYCAKCGAPLYRRIYSNGNRVNWGCSTQKRYTKKVCEGVNVPDSVIRGWNISEDVVIERKEGEYGQKHYSYTSKSKWERERKRAGNKKT